VGLNRLGVGGGADLEFFLVLLEQLAGAIAGELGDAQIVARELRLLKVKIRS